MRRYSTLVLAVCCTVSYPAFGDKELDRIEQLGQAQFRDLSADLGAALSYKAVAPVEPLGLIGFDIGVEVTATQLEHRGAYEQATSGSSPSTLYVPKVHLHKGLPAGIDLGLFYATVPDTNIDLWGAEVRYALIDGGIATPSVGVRGTYSRLSGVDQLELHTRGLELGVSKGFALFTPYAGIGRVWTRSTPAGDAAAAGLEPERFSDTKLFAGANVYFVAANLAVEWDRVGDTTTYSAKFGFRF